MRNATTVTGLSIPWCLSMICAVFLCDDFFLDPTGSCIVIFGSVSRRQNEKELQQLTERLDKTVNRKMWLIFNANIIKNHPISDSKASCADFTHLSRLEALVAVDRTNCRYTELEHIISNVGLSSVFSNRDQIRLWIRIAYNRYQLMCMAVCFR